MLIIKVDAATQESLPKAVQALNDFGELKPIVEKFSSHFHKELFRPALCGKKITIENDNDTVVIQTKEDPRQESVVTDARNISTIFGEVIEIMKCLYNSLFYIEVNWGESTTGKEDTEKITLMQMLWPVFGELYIDTVISDCLSKVIPTSNKELEKFSIVVETTKRFQQSLIECKFMPETNSKLMDYVSNVNVLFADQKSTEILQKARDLMTSNLQNTVFVTEDTVFGKILLGDGGESMDVHKKAGESHTLANFSCLHANTFKLPRCHIR